MLLIILSVSLGACRPSDAPRAQVEKETLARTEFTDRIENFFEYEPLEPGKPSAFLIHLTDLSDGAPVENAEVVLTIRSAARGGIPIEVKARVGRVTGIYIAQVTVPAPGTYAIEFRVRNAKLDERLALDGFATQ